MKRRYFFVINPKAGTRSKDELENFLQEEATKDGVEFHVYHTAKSTNPYLLQHSAEEFAATDVIACGGDGTVNLVAAAVRHTTMNLGIMPVGSGNGLGRAANIPLKPSQAMDIIRKGKVVKADSFSVNRHFACMLSGIGLDAAVAERFAQSTTRGLMTYTTQTLIEFFKAHPYQFQICIDDFSFYTDAFFISVANSNQFGNNVTIAPLASINDGLLDIIVVQKMSKAGLPFALLRQMRGNNKLKDLATSVGKQHILYYQAKSVHVKNLNLAPLHIDGDPVQTDESLSFAIDQSSINLLVP
ncbi:MAG TPA: YegS/Rv2252/BmrU family lipid kinase [Phnomibacter sp.]|nr:YegS/Rv2252/BmrU family lipid kinase [Phnomibacter sp.]